MLGESIESIEMASKPMHVVVWQCEDWKASALRRCCWNLLRHSMDKEHDGWVRGNHEFIFSSSGFSTSSGAGSSSSESDKTTFLLFLLGAGSLK